MIKQPSVKILVGYHKPAYLLKNEVLVPIHLGRALATESSKDGAMSDADYQWMLDNMIGDDTGDNISNLNREFCELTGIYWAWKNYDKIGNPDYIGFMHYRRQFIFNDNKRELFANNPVLAQQSANKINCLNENILKLFSEKEISHSLRGVDVLIPEHVEYNFSVFEQYAKLKNLHELRDLDCVLSIIEEKYPEYIDSTKEYMSSNKHYFWNMFVMKRDIFDNYCKFLFGIVFEMKKKIDFSERNIIKLRGCAYCAERITGIYLTHLQKQHKLSIREKHSLYEEYTDIPQVINPSFNDRSIPIIFSSDNNYASYLAVSIKSLICHCTSDKNYDIFIIDENISGNNKNLLLELIPESANNIKITFINIRPYLKEIDSSVFFHYGYFTPSTYYRFFIPRIFKKFDKAIYLDCDIIILDDISKLYTVNLESHMVAAVRDIEIIRSIRKNADSYKERISYFKEHLGIQNLNNYFQAGVLLFDLDKMRTDNFETKCMETLKHVKKTWYLDQDILNILCENKVKFLPNKWNVEWQLPFKYSNLIEMLSSTDYTNYIQGYSNPSIIHYCSPYKPWNNPDYPKSSYWWHYARMTPFYEEILYKSIKQSISKQKEPDINKEIVSEAFNYTRNKIRYWRYKLLSKITFGKKRKKYKQKKKDLKVRLKSVRMFLKGI